MVLAVLAGLAAAGRGAIPEAERQALIKLYQTTGGDSWTRKDNWLKPGDPTQFNDSGTENTWYGVITDAENTTVIKLLLINNRLSGPIPPELGQLVHLQELRLDRNLQLSGTIPEALNALTELRVLNLYLNKLEGPVPAWLGNLSQLEVLNLLNNSFTGPIPDSLGNLANLRELQLGSHGMDGSLPASLGGLSRLESLMVFNSSISGPIPPELGQLNSLKFLGLASNKLSGEIPGELAGLTGLVQLELGGNELEGTLPDWIAGMPGLSALNLGFNHFHGPIPQAWQNLASIQSFKLNDNDLSGPLPEWLGNQTMNRYLWLNGNAFSGPIPESLGNLTELQNLWLRKNQLTGPIPAVLGNLTKLQRLTLGENQLTGSIPASLGNLVALQELVLDKSQLTGPIPESLGNLSNLQWLYLNHNQLSGPIPVSLGNLSKLTTLYMSQNQLTGPIPDSLGNLTELSELWLDHNQLSGSIPPALISLPKLQRLSLETNLLSGSIPDFPSTVPTLKVLYLHNNQLSGSIPSTIMNLTTLLALRLDYNALHADSTALANFINQKTNLYSGYDYRNYQTLPPTALTTSELGAGAVRLTWASDPDPAHNYTGAGGYEVWQRQGAYGNWKLRDVIVDKNATSWTGSLAAGETNNFRLTTFTFPWAYNQNQVASEPTTPLAVNPPGGGQPMTVHVDSVRHGDIYKDSPSQVAPASPLTVRIDPSAFAGASLGTPYILWIALPPRVTLSQTLATGNPASAAPLPLAGERVLDLAVVEYRIGTGSLPEPVEGSPLASISPHAVQLLRYVAGENVIQVRISESSAQWLPRNGGDFVGFTLGLAAGAWPKTGASNWGPEGVGAQASTLLCLDLREAGLAAGGEFPVTMYATKQPSGQFLPLTFDGSGYKVFTVDQSLTGEIPFTFALGTPIEDFDTADVDGDGVDDLVAITPGEGRVYWSLGQRGGGFAGIYWVDLPAVPTRVDLADVDSNSHPDVLAADDAGTLHVYLWDSLFGPQKASTKAVSPERSLRLAGLVTDARVCDVTGDNQKDYVFCDATGGRVHILAGPTFSSDLSYTAGTEPSALTAGDFNADGAPDLAAANAGSFSVSVFWNDGTGHFTASTLADVGVRPVDLDAGDFNRDGRADLAVALAGDKAVGILLAQPGNQFAAPGQKIFFQSTPSAVLADNFDGEAGADALVGFADSSRLAVCVSDAAGALQHRCSIDTLGDAALDASGQTVTLAADQVLSVAGGTSLGGISSRQGAAVIASLGVNLIHFPRSRDLSFSEVNLGEVDALVNLELYADGGGAPLATATDAIPAGAQYARYLSDVLGPAAGEPGRWVRAFLTAPDTYGIWLANDPALTYLDGTRMPDARDAQSRLLFPVVQSGGGSATTIELINPLRLPANLMLTVYGPTGGVKSTQTAVLGGRGRLELDAAARFPGIAEGDSIEVTAERGIVGLELFGDADTVACLEAMEGDATGAVLYAPHVATGDFGVAYQSVLTLVNTSDASLSVDLTLYSDDGSPVAGASRQIPPTASWKRKWQICSDSQAPSPATSPPTRTAPPAWPAA